VTFLGLRRLNACRFFSTDRLIFSRCERLFFLRADPGSPRSQVSFFARPAPVTPRFLCCPAIERTVRDICSLFVLSTPDICLFTAVLSSFKPVSSLRSLAAAYSGPPAVLLFGCSDLFSLSHTGDQFAFDFFFRPFRATAFPTAGWSGLFFLAAFTLLGKFLSCRRSLFDCRRAVSLSAGVHIKTPVVASAD